MTGEEGNFSEVAQPAGMELREYFARHLFCGCVQSLQSF